MALLCVWVVLMERWKAHLDQSPSGDAREFENWLLRNWPVLSMAVGAVLLVWGLTGWTPVGPRSIGGLRDVDRQAITWGAAFIAIGVVRQIQRRAD